MILSESDAVYAADKFIDYYTQFNRIDDYLRHIKEDRGENRSGFFQGLVQTRICLISLICILMT